MDILVDDVEMIYHRAGRLGLTQSCHVCGKEYGVVDLCVRFTFNNPEEEAYILRQESERPVICCGEEVVLLASFSSEESADKVMRGYANLCMALHQSSSPLRKSSVKVVIPSVSLDEFISSVRNLS